MNAQKSEAEKWENTERNTMMISRRMRSDCYECFEACLNEADVQARTKCIKMLVECARMCEMSVASMSSNAIFAKEHCKLCANVCDACAQECELFKDQHCQQCAQECRTCADECRSMAGM